VTAEFDRANKLQMALISLRNAIRLRSLTGASVADVLKSAYALSRSGNVSWSQALMAGNAPVLIQRAVEGGEPDEGVMATGQVAGRLSDLPSCEELVRRIAEEAAGRLEALRRGVETANLTLEKSDADSHRNSDPRRRASP